MTREVSAAAALTAPGFWCERFVYRSVDADDLVSWSGVAAQSPLRAVRLISADARRMAVRLPERARQRVLGQVSGQGQVGAMVALDRNEPCGLALDCGGAWVEWSARPVLFLPLVRHTGSGPLCSRRADQAEGWTRPCGQGITPSPLRAQPWPGAAANPNQPNGYGGIEN